MKWDNLIISRRNGTNLVRLASNPNETLQSLFLNFLQNDREGTSVCVCVCACARAPVGWPKRYFLFFWCHIFYLKSSTSHYILEISLVSLVMQHTHYLVPMVFVAFHLLITETLPGLSATIASHTLSNAFSSGKGGVDGWA